MYVYLYICRHIWIDYTIVKTELGLPTNRLPRIQCVMTILGYDCYQLSGYIIPWYEIDG